jgi:hypothetical protein
LALRWGLWGPKNWNASISNQTFQAIVGNARSELPRNCVYPPELETLDQLCGGPMPLAVIRQLFEGDDRFRRAILAMLDDREVLLFNGDDFESQTGSGINY